ncbi:hypothetical protein CONPUDRAFT_74017 [Coniophora puteana RWD-64-598 SS2]|uniref:EF-hand domain-containing protein n=1 Tax=Coniophora puteana (strain RWD-64-598) TaxID=741705 RepID=A0A5M3MK80_CONPW|nr:uncharacterized protein CONPUDRAFT_74017 [Coniophora puteana RWD-64-598 SS2]EIW79639.1 hypothetical protein CONPUDRAFT_74017 [Coniophora puteana RWD-64-598 SS2]
MSSPSDHEPEQQVAPASIEECLNRLNDSIPRAQKALDEAWLCTSEIQHGTVLVPSIKAKVVKIVSSEQQVVRVVNDVSKAYQVAGVTFSVLRTDIVPLTDDVTVVVGYSQFKLIEVELQKKTEANHQIAIVCWAMSNAVFRLYRLHRLLQGHPESLTEDLKGELEDALSNLYDTMYGFAFATKVEAPVVAVLRASELKKDFMQYWEDFDHHRRRLDELLGSQAVASNFNIDIIFKRIGRSNPKEIEASDWVKQQGGAKRVLENTELLSILAKFLGDGSNGNLRKTLRQDMDEILNNNKQVIRRSYEYKIECAARQIEDAVKSSEDTIMSQLNSGPHDLIKDDGIKFIWKENVTLGLTKSNKAVQEFYEKRVQEQKQKQPGSTHPDEWTLPFLSKVTYRPAISDAIDIDGSGYISVDECNTFLASRPQGLSVPGWMAFWAIAWLMNNEDYCERIETMINGIKTLMENINVKEEEAVESYLSWIGFVDPIVLQSLNAGAAGNTPIDFETDDLHRVLEVYRKNEEDRLSAELQKLDFYIEDAATLRFIAREDRIELVIMPLLYLIVQHHSTVIEQLKKKTVKMSELWGLQNTLNQVLLSFNRRLDELERAWKQQRMDVDVQVEIFAGGIFNGWYTKRQNPDDEIASLLAFWNPPAKGINGENAKKPAAKVTANEALLQSIAKKFGVPASDLVQKVGSFAQKTEVAPQARVKNQDDSTGQDNDSQQDQDDIQDLNDVQDQGEEQNRDQGEEKDQAEEQNQEQEQDQDQDQDDDQDQSEGQDQGEERDEDEEKDQDQDEEKDQDQDEEKDQDDDQHQGEEQDQGNEQGSEDDEQGPNDDQDQDDK